MGKQKQQVISRFFAPKLKPTSPPEKEPPPPPPPPPRSTPSKVTTTVSFSPAKRKLLSPHLLSSSKKPKNAKPNLLEPATSSSAKYTPLEQQVIDLKNKYPDVVLMIEVGYRYRFFGQDAEIAAKVLGIIAHMDKNFMTASVPTFRLNVHVRRLVYAGYKVGVVKQTETAAIKARGDNKMGPFGRCLSALYTKATLEAAEEVGGVGEECGGESNYMVCVVEKEIVDKESHDGFDCDVKIGVLAVEVSTGDVVYGEFKDGFMRSGLEAVVISLSPAEVILAQPLSKLTEKSFSGPTSNVRLEHVSRGCFNDGGALAEVITLYDKIGEDNSEVDQRHETETRDHADHAPAIEVIMNMPDLVVQALALTIRHLKEFGFERIMRLGASFRSLSSNKEMNLSANTLKQLEVLRNNMDGSESGSLVQIMNRTLTTFGSRLLKRWVTHPLCDRNMISARLDAVSEIAESMGSCKAAQSVNSLDEENHDITIVQPDLYYLLSSILTTLGRSPDIQRGITRIFHRTATAPEFVGVIQAILNAGKQLQRLHIEDDYSSQKVNSGLLNKLILTASSPGVVGSAAKLLSSLNKEAADQKDLSNLLIISNGQFPEVAEARKTVQLQKEKLDSLIALFRKQLRNHCLEFFTVSGTTHLIELSVDVKVPLNWVKVNSTKKTTRYHPPEVLTALDQLLLANEELTIVCRAAWDNFLRGFDEYYAELQAAVQALAALDCLHSLALLSRNNDYVRPVFVHDDEPVQMHISSGRHPVLETTLQDNFVPNDTNLHTDKEHCQIVTGPNMGGKSCYIRQVALITLMAQVGSFVPASSAKLHVLDGIYTRMGASDSIQQGRSTFLEELSETSHILHNCSTSSLVIIDELGRGTSTHDGVAIAYATLRYLLKQKRCMVLFVTHYPKIADIKIEFPGSVGVYHVSYLTSDKSLGSLDSDEDVTYLYKVVPGISQRSFGFKVAELAQLPTSCISRATMMAAKLEEVVNNRLAKRQLVETAEIEEKEEAQGSTSILDNYNRPWASNNEFLVDSNKGYKEFFSKLKFALLEEDDVKGFQLLKCARSIAEEILSR
ncbi:hypothetical protein ACFE04_028201 [Oxalis oulophora]